MHTTHTRTRTRVRKIVGCDARACRIPSRGRVTEWATQVCNTCVHIRACIRTADVNTCRMHTGRHGRDNSARHDGDFIFYPPLPCAYVTAGCLVVRGTGGRCSCCSCWPRDSSPSTDNADRTPRIDRRSRTSRTSWRYTRLSWGPTGRGRDSHDIIRSGSPRRSLANWSVSFSLLVSNELDRWVRRAWNKGMITLILRMVLAAVYI